MLKTKPKILRTNTIGGDPAKYVYYLLKSDNPEIVLIIHKLILTKNPKPFNTLGFIATKQFKDYYLVRQIFSIKSTSLSHILAGINSMV